MRGDNIALKRGKLGDTVFYVLHGKQMARLRVRHIHNPKTACQETPRTKMYNLCAMYRAMQGMLRYSFETKAENNNPWNAFVKMNMSRVECYLSKDYVTFNAAVVQPYMVSCGTIESVRMTRCESSGRTSSEEAFVSNISLGGLTLDEDTTVAEFSSAVISANNGYLCLGDQLTFVSVAQIWYKGSGCPIKGGVPDVDVKYYGVVLNTNDSTPLRNYLPGFARVSCDGFLGVSTDTPKGGFCYMVSREDKEGKLHVSTQVLVDNGMLDCSTSEYRNAAIRSYKAKPDRNPEIRKMPGSDILVMMAERAARGMNLNNEHSPWGRRDYCADSHDNSYLKTDKLRRFDYGPWGRRNL